MTRSDKVFFRWVSMALNSGNAEALGRACSQFGTYCFDDEASATRVGMIEDEVWEQMLASLSDTRLQNLDGSFRFVLLFLSEWARSSQKQKGELLSTIDATCAKFLDDASWLLFAELLGKYFCNVASLNVLNRLSSGGSPMMRAVMVEGYWHLGRTTQLPELRKAVLRRLEELRDDCELLVSEVAAEKLQDISL